MKKLLLIAPLVSASLLANGNHAKPEKLALVQEYKEMFAKIKEKRVGISERKIDALKNPFIELEKKVEAKTEENRESSLFELQAIFGKKAKISGKWYKLGDKVNGMEVVAIKGNYVWLKNSKFRKKIIMGSKNEKISIQ